MSAKMHVGHEYDPKLGLDPTSRDCEMESEGVLVRSRTELFGVADRSRANGCNAGAYSSKRYEPLYSSSSDYYIYNPIK